MSLKDHAFTLSETHRIIGVLALLAQPSNVADVMIESMNKALIQRGMQHATIAVNRPPAGIPIRPASPTSDATSAQPTPDTPKGS